MNYGDKIRINDKVIDIDCFLKRNINDIVYSKKTKLCSDKEAESGADRYIKKLNAPGCRKFFLKVMYYLPYETREGILESATRDWVKSPSHYFTYSAKKELVKRGIN